MSMTWHITLNVWPRLAWPRLSQLSLQSLVQSNPIQGSSWLAKHHSTPRSQVKNRSAFTHSQSKCFLHQESVWKENKNIVGEFPQRVTDFFLWLSFRVLLECKTWGHKTQQTTQVIERKYILCLHTFAVRVTGPKFFEHFSLNEQLTSNLTADKSGVVVLQHLVFRVLLTNSSQGN